MNLLQKYKAWRKKRYWEKRHLEFLQNMLREDARWLSIHPLAKEICDRHELAASKDWYKTEFRGISEFRNKWEDNQELYVKIMAPVYFEQKEIDSRQLAQIISICDFVLAIQTDRESKDWQMMHISISEAVEAAKYLKGLYK